MLFSQLCDHLYIQRNYAKSLNSLFTRMCSKISNVTALQLIHFKNNRPINHLNIPLLFKPHNVLIFSIVVTSFINSLIIPC